MLIQFEYQSEFIEKLRILNNPPQRNIDPSTEIVPPLNFFLSSRQFCFVFLFSKTFLLAGEHYIFGPKIVYCIFNRMFKSSSVGQKGHIISLAFMVFFFVHHE